MQKKQMAAGLCLLFLLTSAWGFGGGPKYMSVQVRTGQLREKPSFLGKVTASVSYGDRVQVMEEGGAWLRVDTGEDQGWIHESALTKKRIALRSGEREAQVAATSDEIALAGKGFNAQVEAEYKAKNRNVDFSAIDRMERIKVTEQASLEFLRVGELAPGEGGAR